MSLANSSKQKSRQLRGEAQAQRRHVCRSLQVEYILLMLLTVRFARGPRDFCGGWTGFNSGSDDDPSELSSVKVVDRATTPK